MTGSPRSDEDEGDGGVAPGVSTPYVGLLEPEMPPPLPASSEGSTGMVPIVSIVVLKVDETQG